MVKLRPDKVNLEEGYSAPSTIFKDMGLYLGDEFENRKGDKLIVKEESPEKWYVERADSNG
ncbi:MAG: hypothetical protein ACLFNY_06565 [Candidatus Aenigmatarchaeota archaeon]